MLVTAYAYNSATGRQATVTDGAGRQTRTFYDDLGRVTGISQQFDLDAAASAWWFGGVSPDDRSVAIDYHPDGRREELRRMDREGYSGSDPYETIAADWRGLSKYSYTNDDTSKLTLLEHLLSDDNTERIATYGYSYIDTGLGVRIGTYDSDFYDFTTSPVFERSQSFTYDGRHQLIDVTTADNGASGSIHAYKYDANGNRLEETIDSLPAPAFENVLDRNRLLEDATHTYVYDGEGNLLERIDKTSGDKDVSTWDHRNRLTSVEIWEYDTQTSQLVQQTEVTYAYDGLDRLIGREEENVVSSQTFSTSMYVNDGSGRVLDLFYDSTVPDGVIFLGYLRGPAPGEVLAMDVSVPGESPDPGDTDTEWTFADPSGSIRSYVEVNPTSGTPHYRHEQFDEFGRPQSQQTGGFTLLSHDLAPAIFDGQFYDAATNLYVDEAGGNAYLPDIGRTLTGEAYAYQRNNPIHPERVNAQALSGMNGVGGAGLNGDNRTFSDRLIIGLVGEERLASASDEAVIGGSVISGILGGIAIFKTAPASLYVLGTTGLSSSNVVGAAALKSAGSSLTFGSLSLTAGRFAGLWVSCVEKHPSVRHD